MSISTKVVFNRKTMEQVTESRRKPIVVGIGELLWDMLPSGKKAGGAPINFVYHASCLGAEGYAISAVGDDELGKEIVDELDKNHIQHLIEKVPYPTGTVQVELREGIPTYTIHERVAWDHISPTSDRLIWRRKRTLFVSVHWPSVPVSLGRRYKRSHRLRRKTLIVCWISIFASDTMIRS